MEQRDTGWSAEELSQIAYWQKFIIRLIICQIVVVLLIVFTPPIMNTISRAATGVIGIITMSLAIIINILCVYGMYKLASAMRNTSAILYVLFVLIPMIALIVLLFLSFNATSILQKNGIRVGFMGANQADIDRLALGA